MSYWAHGPCAHQVSLRYLEKWARYDHFLTTTTTTSIIIIIIAKMKPHKNKIPFPYRGNGIIMKNDSTITVVKDWSILGIHTLMGRHLYCDSYFILAISMRIEATITFQQDVGGMLKGRFPVFSSRPRWWTPCTGWPSFSMSVVTTPEQPSTSTLSECW